MEILVILGCLCIIFIINIFTIESYSGPKLRSKIGDIYIKINSKTRKGRDNLFNNKRSVVLFYASKKFT